MQEKIRPLSLDTSQTVRIDINDKIDLENIKGITGVPICKLIHIAIPLLRRKYRIKQDNGDNA